MTDEDHHRDVARLQALLQKHRSSEEPAVQVMAPTPDNLRRIGAIIREEHEFYPDQLVCWKPFVKNRRWPATDQPAVVVEVLDEPVRDPTQNAGTPYFNEALDLRLAYLDADGEVQIGHFPSELMQPWQGS